VLHGTVFVSHSKGQRSFEGRSFQATSKQVLRQIKHYAHDNNILKSHSKKWNDCNRIRYFSFDLVVEIKTGSIQETRVIFSTINVTNVKWRKWNCFRLQVGSFWLALLDLIMPMSAIYLRSGGVIIMGEDINDSLWLSQCAGKYITPALLQSGHMLCYVAATNMDGWMAGSDKQTDR